MVQASQPLRTPFTERDIEGAASATAASRTAPWRGCASWLGAFLDKTFGFGYASQSGKRRIDGGSPTQGFLGGVAVGPMESMFHDWAGAGWVDWLFMLGLLGIGIIYTAVLRALAVAGAGATWPGQGLGTAAVRQPQPPAAVTTRSGPGRHRDFAVAPRFRGAATESESAC
jgi:hypothetical protein